MIYEYQCKETGEIVEREFDMHSKIPPFVEEGGKKYKRVFTKAIHIPFQWSKESSLNFKKSPSGKKHFY